MPLHASGFPLAQLNRGTLIKDRPVARPDILDLGAQTIHAVLADGMIEDLRTLRRINDILKATGRSDLKRRNGGTYKPMAVLDVSPDNGTLSRLANQFKNVEDPNDRALIRFFSRFGGESGRNELLSYLLFEPGYFKAQFECGAQRACDRLAEHPEFR
jgi:hypothetical protein